MDFSILIIVLALCIGTALTFAPIIEWEYKLSLGTLCAIGAALLTVWASISYYVGLPLLIVAATPTLLLISAALKRDFWMRLLSKEILYLIVVYFLYKQIIFRDEQFVTRLHVGPDAYGVASAFGMMSDSFSINTIFENFKNITGLSEPIWINPPFFKSIWNIPDAQLRFAGDQIIGSGRIGIPAVLATLSFILPKISFFHLFTLFGLIGLWCQAAISFDMFRFALNRKITHVAEFIAYLVLPVSFLSQLYLLEGLTTQIWQQAFLLLVYLQYLLALNSRGNSYKNIFQNFYILSLITICIYLTYPDSLISLLVLVAGTIVLFAITLMLGRVKINYPKILQFLPVVIIPCFAFVFDDRFQALVLSRFTDVASASNAGGAIHLGLPTYFSLLGFSAVSNTMLFMKDGFVNISQDVKLAAIVHLTTIVMCLITCLILLKDRLLLTLQVTTPAIVLSAVPAFFLFRIWQGEVVSDYVYFRTLSNYVAFSFPWVILGSFTIIAIPIQAIKVSVTFLNKAICTLVLIISFHLISASTKEYVDVSRLAYNPKGCLVGFNLKQTIFVSNNADQTFISYTECAGPFYYLTDNWGPHLKADGREYDVVELIADHKGMSSSRIGKINLTNDLHGPCNLNCIRQSPMFRQLEH